MKQLTMARQIGGFTLIEILVAMFLLAFMSIMSYQAIDAVLKINDRSQQSLAQEARLQRAWQIIGRDIIHLRPRTFIDGLGATERAYVTDPSEFGVRFSRGGGPMVRSNPSGLRRIEYRVNDDAQLIRQSWAITESPRLSDGSTMVLVDNVEKVRFEHLTKSNIYSEDWPPINETHEPTSLPKMIRVIIVLEGGRETSKLLPGVVVE